MTERHRVRPWLSSFRRRHALALAAVVLLGIGCSALFLGGHYDGPVCRPHSRRCLRTKDGYWVPVFYFRALQKSQDVPRRFWASAGGVGAVSPIPGGYLPLAGGAQPTTEDLEETGAASQQIDQVEPAGDDGGGDGDDDGGGDGDNGGDGGDG
jgi:hypothetical protein